MMVLRQLCRDVALGTDRHLDITLISQVVESSSLVSVFLEKHLAIHTSPFFPFTSKWFLCYRVINIETYS